MLHAQLFGSFNLFYDDTAVPLPTRSTAKTLLAYLLLNKNKTHSRSHLATLLASEASEERARRTLSQALWQLRQSIVIPLIHSDGEQIYILPDAPLSIDVTQFTALIDPQQPHTPLSNDRATAWQQAISLYHGDLLDGFYDDWVLLRREQLREIYLQTLSSLGKWEKENGRYQSALNHLLQLLQYDSLRESAHREVMRCYALLGRPEAALRQFDLCTQILSHELDIAPEPATHQLRQEIITHRKTDRSTTRQTILGNSDTLPLIGRKKERTTLLRLLKNSSQQQGSIALIESPAGTGKTHLLQTIAQDATWRNFQVLWGTTSESGATIPYGAIITTPALTPLHIAQLHNIIEPVWMNLVAQLIPELAVNPPQSPSSPTDTPLNAQLQLDQIHLLEEALVRLLIGWSKLSPLLIILDDVHQADSATFDMLTLLAQRIAKQRIVLIVSYRGEEARKTSFVWQGLQTLDETAVSQRLILTDLPRNNSSHLIRTALQLDTPAPTFEQRIFEATSGNPLFILETLRALRDSGVLHRNEQEEWTTDWDTITVDYSEITLPAHLDKAIQQRIKQLHPHTRQLLKAASVLQSEFNLPLLQAISPLETEQTLTAVTDLIQKQFLTEHPATYTFNHQTIRQATYATLTPDAQQQAHQRTANALTTLQPQAVESIAYHYHQAQQPTQAIHYYQKSAQNALQHFALATARLHLDHALALADAANLPANDRFTLHAQHETIAEVLGDYDMRHSDLLQMARWAAGNPQQAIETERRFVSYYTFAAPPNFDKAVQHAEAGLHLAQQLGDAVCIAAMHTAWGHTLTVRGDMEEALPHFDKALTLHQHLNDPQAHATLLRNYATALRTVGQHPDALKAVQSALRLLEQSDDKFSQSNTLSELAMIHHEQGNIDQAIICYRQTLDLTREIGYRYREAATLLNWGNLLWFEGEINQTLTNYKEASIIFGELGNTHAEAQLRGNLASFLVYPFADFELAHHHAQWALAQCRQLKDLIGVGQALTTLSAIALENGDLEQADAYLAEGLAAMQTSAGGSYLYAMMLRDGATLALERKQPEAALLLVDEGLALCAEAGMADIEVLLTAIRGVTLLHLNREEEALAATSKAMTEPRDGVNQDYVIPMWHATVLEALQQKIPAARAWDEAYKRLQTYVLPLTVQQRERALARIADYRTIMAAWEAGRTQITVSLPAVTAPTGRPLRDDEFVTVQWTIETVADTAVTNKKERRQQQLLRLLNEAASQHAAPTIQDCATALHVSTGTIKRDLAALRQVGHPTPTRGHQ